MIENDDLGKKKFLISHGLGRKFPKIGFFVQNNIVHARTCASFIAMIIYALNVITTIFMVV